MTSAPPGPLAAITGVGTSTACQRWLRVYPSATSRSAVGPSATNVERPSASRPVTMRRDWNPRCSPAIVLVLSWGTCCERAVRRSGRTGISVGAASGGAVLVLVPLPVEGLVEGRVVHVDALVDELAVDHGDLGGGLDLDHDPAGEGPAPDRLEEDDAAVLLPGVHQVVTEGHDVVERLVEGREDV